MSELTSVGKTKRTLWDNKTSRCWLHGIEYRVLEDSNDIYDYVNTTIRKELEADIVTMRNGPNSNEIIGSLAARKWRLEIVKLCDIELNPKILQSSDIKTGRQFGDRLKERTSELRRVLDHDRVAIWPLIMVNNNHLLIDGYCRHSTLAEMGIPRVYGYSGLAFKS